MKATYTPGRPACRLPIISAIRETSKVGSTAFASNRIPASTVICVSPGKKPAVGRDDPASRRTRLEHPLRSRANVQGWVAKSVADTEPANWTIVTCDLFQDFGECSLTGMALTSFAGSAHFDHIYLGRSIDDLDRIDIVGLRRPGKSLPLAADQLEGLWTDLISDNAANVYRSVWTLTAGPDAAVPFLKGKLPATGPGPRVDPKQFRQWILELDHDSFLVRERASMALKNHLTPAIPLLRKELEQPKITPEVRLRIGQLLKLAAPEDIISRTTSPRSRDSRVRAHRDARGPQPTYRTC